MHSLRRHAGFSLTELMVTVAVLAIIAAIAVPGYQSYTQKARRASAHTALEDAAQRQEQFFLDARSYTTTAGSGGLNVSATTAGGHYTLSVAAAAAACPINRCYVLEAVPQGTQADDAGCNPIRLTSSGERSPAECW